MARTSVSARRRARLLAVNNRILVRTERAIARDVRTIFREVNTRGIEQARTSRNASAIVQGLKEQATKDLAAVLKVHMLRLALLFGTTVFERLKDSGHLAPKKSLTASLETKDFESDFNASVRMFVADRSFEQADSIMSNYLDGFRNILQDSFDQGLSISELADNLQSEMAGLSDTAAERIARTEAHTAANFGSQEAAESTNIDLIKEWGATDDPRTRPSHQQADGQRTSLDGTFSVGGASLAYPGDPAGPPQEVINCRCTVLYYPVVNGEVITS